MLKQKDVPLDTRNWVKKKEICIYSIGVLSGVNTLLRGLEPNLFTGHPVNLRTCHSLLC